MKDKKNILIGALLFTILVMAVGYAAFATTLNINGTATIAGSWDVEITGITSDTTHGGTDKIGTPSFTPTVATFDVEFAKPGDYAIYTVTVENKGTIDAKLDSFTFVDQNDGPADIKFSIVSQPTASSILAAGGTATFEVKAEYDANATTVLGTSADKDKTVKGVIEYVQAN